MSSKQMDSQKHLFQLPVDSIYLNAAYMSPLLTSVENKGIAGMIKKRNPAGIGKDDFFQEIEELRKAFAHLVSGTPADTAIIPSTSYGFASLFHGMHARGRKKALTIQDEFPSGYLALDTWCKREEVQLEIIAPRQGETWTNQIIQAIDTDSSVLLMSSVHWMDGSLFDLQRIGNRCKETGTYFIIDGTQSVGAMPFSVQGVYCDAVVCAGYKWLMGPYGIGMMWVGPALQTGAPIEDSWMNRTNAQDFARLTTYGKEYITGAAKFNVGETSNFILVPMLLEAIRQLMEWGPEHISAHCANLQEYLSGQLATHAPNILLLAGKSPHLFGLTLPEGMQAETVISQLQAQSISVSQRGDFIRISPHVYNNRNDLDKLVSALAE